MQFKFKYIFGIEIQNFRQPVDDSRNISTPKLRPFMDILIKMVI